ncbi:MAG: hypothetical protein KGI68_01595 [Alphaproteobacteria bacterium]|nr:hypothetical protein [Alphaproteobacteria bacterium]MDE2266068.1 hypothetical protein [Alphaproteobacteria bacterium]
MRDDYHGCLAFYISHFGTRNRSRALQLRATDYFSYHDKKSQRLIAIERAVDMLA